MDDVLFCGVPDAGVSFESAGEPSIARCFVSLHIDVLWNQLVVFAAAFGANDCVCGSVAFQGSTRMVNKSYIMSDLAWPLFFFEVVKTDA